MLLRKYLLEKNHTVFPSIPELKRLIQILSKLSDLFSWNCISNWKIDSGLTNRLWCNSIFQMMDLGIDGVQVLEGFSIRILKMDVNVQVKKEIDGEEAIEEEFKKRIRVVM